MLNNLLAQAGGEAIQIAPQTQFSGIQGATVGGMISAAVTLVLIVAGVIFFFMLIIGGLRWILSGGDKAQTESARNQITAALVGLVIVFAAFAIVALINTLFGVDILNIQLPSFVAAG